MGVGAQGGVSAGAVGEGGCLGRDPLLNKPLVICHHCSETLRHAYRFIVKKILPICPTGDLSGWSGYCLHYLLVQCLSQPSAPSRGKSPWECSQMCVVGAMSGDVTVAHLWEGKAR